MFDKLYENVGDKIQDVAKVIFILITIGVIICGLVFLVNFGFEDAWWALLMIFVGPIVSLVCSWMVYAFGELVENVQIIRSQNEEMRKENKQGAVSQNAQNNAQPQKDDWLKRLALQTPDSLGKRCPYCGEIVKSEKCDICGKEINF